MYITHLCRQRTMGSLTACSLVCCSPINCKYLYCALESDWCLGRPQEYRYAIEEPCTKLCLYHTTCDVSREIFNVLSPSVQEKSPGFFNGMFIGSWFFNLQYCISVQSIWEGGPPFPLTCGRIHLFSFPNN